MRKRSIAVLGVGVAGIVGLVWGVPYARNAIERYRYAQKAALRMPAAERTWKKEFGDPAATLAAVPRRDDNESAVQLRSLAKPLGIDLVSSTGAHAVQYPHESEADRALNQAIHDYIYAELTKVGGSVNPPPTVFRDHLESHAKSLDALVKLLSSSQTPAWKSNAELGAEAPVPNLLGLMRLQRLLVALALSRAAAGDHREAEQTFYSAWCLNKSLRDRPEIISQIIAIAAARMHVGLARRVSLDPVPWRGRLREHDYRASVLNALVVEADALQHRFPVGRSVWDRAFHADYLDSRRTLLVGLRDAPIGDGPLPTSEPGGLQDPSSAGAIVTAIANPNLADMMRRANRLAIDAELTDHVLQAQILRDRLGHWPEEIPEIEATRVPDARWIYSMDEGRPTIFLSRDLHWESLSGLVLPLRYQPT